MSSRSRRRSERRRPARGVRRGSKWALWVALLAVTIGSPMLLGGALEYASLALAVVAALWLIGTRALIGSAGEDRALTLPVMLCFAALAWTLIQLMPLPRAFVEALQPAVVARVDATHALLGLDPASWLPLTFEPGATREAAIGLAAVLAASLAATWTAARLGRTALLTGVAASTAAVALITVIHALLGAQSVFGLYEPKFATPHLLGPLLNVNHLGGFVAMGAPLAVGLAVDSRSVAERAAWAVAALLTIGVVFATLSRAAAVSLVVGFVVMALLTLRQRGLVVRRIGTAVGLVTLVIGAGLAFQADRVIEQFRIDDYEKLEVIERSMALAADHSWIGVGRGAFAAAFVERWGGDALFEFAESFPVHWAAEWGLLFSAAVIGAGARGWWGAAAGATSWSRVGGCAALASIATHDLADFAVELTGLAVVVTILYVALVTPRSERDVGAGDSGVRRGRWLGATLLVPVAIALCGPWRAPNDSRERAGGVVALEERDWVRFDASLHDALLAHPGDPALVLLGARASVARGQAGAIRWLNEAMRLAPGWPGPHLLAARWLMARGARSQAHLEIREAERRQSRSGAWFICDWLRRGYSTATLVASAAPPEHRDTFLDRAASCLSWNHPVTAEIDALVSADSDLPGPALRAARREQAGGRPAEALAVLRRRLGGRDADEQIVDAAAALMVELGRAAEAAALVEARLSASPGSERLLARLATVQASEQDAAAVRSTIVRLRGRASGDPARIARSFVLLATLEERMGNLARALAASEEAFRVGGDPSALRRAGDLADRLGDRGRAYRIRADLCRQTGPGGADCAAWERMRAGLEPSRRDLQRTEP